MLYQLGKIVRPDQKKELYFGHMEGKLVWLEVGEPILEEILSPRGGLDLSFCYKSNLEVWDPEEVSDIKLRFDKNYIELLPEVSIDPPLVPYEVWSKKDYSGVVLSRGEKNEAL